MERKRIAEIMALPNSVFVFGSNLAGVHGAGAAKEAATRYGAVRGHGEGMAGRSYAIPTKGSWRDPVGLPLGQIEVFVQTFIRYAYGHPVHLFAVTRIGCGYAGYTDRQIAPLFSDAPPNCLLPPEWESIRF